MKETLAKKMDAMHERMATRAAMLRKRSLHAALEKAKAAEREPAPVETDTPASKTTRKS